MDHNMFCFQCEQTAGCTGCTSRGVCGKDAQTAQAQDRLTGALIGLARAADTSPDAGPETWQLMIEGLFATLTNVNFDPDSLHTLTARVWVEKQRLVPDCAVCTAPCGRTGDYDLAQLWGAQEDIRSLKSLLLFGSRGMAAYAYHAMVLGYRDETVERFLSKALFAVGEDWSMEELLPLVLELGGYAETQHRTGLNGGTGTTTGFAHDAVLANAAQIVEAVRSGAIRHFFLVGGCDGARAGRNYYTEFVRQTPPDTVVLTLACGKYRFHDMDLGTVAGLPRLLDIGQCNDAYSAIQIALALAEAFHCGVNDLPLSMVLSWYEQKAVCILLTLLHLGIRNIRLGPTLPAFLSPNVLQYLVEHYAIAPITTPEADLAALLGS